MIRKIVNGLSTVVMVLVVLLALTLVGGRLFGMQTYAVLSGSMEPAYPTGALLYVRKVDPADIQPGQVITFLLDEHTVATHRVVEVIPDPEEAGIYRYRTKGDANEAADAGLVHCRNVLGTPVASIPYLGYVITWIQNPPGTYIAISAAAVLLLLVFLPDLFAEDKKKPAPDAESR
jgi:signal peptidase